MAFVLEIIEFISAILNGLFSVLRKKSNPSWEERDILILPGWGAGPGFYSKLKDSLSSAGYRPGILKVPPFCKENEYLELLNQALQTCSQPMICIAHNTSGLVIGALPDATRRKINTLITLGTPFKGYKILGLITQKGHEPNSPLLENRLTTYLFINHFYPLSPIKEYLFFPKGENLVYGQGRDQWFDVPGNYNLVQRSENLRTLVEFLLSVHPTNQKSIIQKEQGLEEEKLNLPVRTVQPSKKPKPKKKIPPPKSVTKPLKKTVTKKTKPKGKNAKK